MTQSGHIIFGQTDEIIFGKPAAEAVDDVVSRLGVSLPIPWIPHNPRPITSASQIMEILKMAA